MDLGAVGREHIEAVGHLGVVADFQRVRLAGGGELERDGGMVESVIGQRQAALGEIGDGEAGFMLKELELVDQAADGIGIGGPFVRLGEAPRFPVAFELHRHAGASAAGEGVDCRDLRPQHPLARLKGGALRPPLFFKLENVEEKDDVEKEENDSNFGAHGSGRSTFSNPQPARDR